MPTQTKIETRPFREEDRAAITDFQNRELPPHLRGTVAEGERGDARRALEEVRLRLCIGEPAIAYMDIRDLGTAAYRLPGVCGFHIHVAPEHRRRGLGSALYEKAVEFAQQRGSKRLRTYFRLLRPDYPAVRFLEQRGFVEVERDVPVMLDLTTFDPERIASPKLDGVHLLSLADAGDTEDNRRRLHALDGAIHPDIPTHDVKSTHPPFEQWNKMLDGPEFDPGAVILAETADEAWIGLCVLGFQEDTNIGWTFITGVLPQHRGQGLALALKLRALAAAQARGSRLILTENHEDNAPMRAINRKLGFQPDFPGISYSKDLEKEITHANADNV